MSKYTRRVLKGAKMSKRMHSRHLALPFPFRLALYSRDGLPRMYRVDQRKDQGSRRGGKTCSGGTLGKGSGANVQRNDPYRTRNEGAAVTKYLLRVGDSVCKIIYASPGTRCITRGIPSRTRPRTDRSGCRQRLAAQLRQHLCPPELWKADGSKTKGSELHRQSGRFVSFLENERHAPEWRD